MSNDATWKIFRGTRVPHDGIARLPQPPSWRPYRGTVDDDRTWPLDQQGDEALPVITRKRGTVFHVTEQIVDMVNAALYLRRPLLVTGHPGSGKSSLVDAIAYELRMGPPLRWSVTSRSTLQDALYRYDAIGRLQQGGSDTGDIGRFITLGPLGTALLPTRRPRALLIDEIDKSDIDLPNDLLNVFEEGEFEISELRRLAPGGDVTVFTSDRCQPEVKVKGARIAAYEFPLMILTSNGEREFPAAFLRRCLRLQMPNPTGTQPEDDNADWQRLDAIIKLHFENEEDQAQARSVLDEFKRSATPGKEVATDQLLNAIYFVLSSRIGAAHKRDELIRILTRELTSTNR
jgi:energy-coupling factor transporter ATP-binding protein EcfA2